jgi:hypothetical protein
MSQAHIITTKPRWLELSPWGVAAGALGGAGGLRAPQPGARVQVHIYTGGYGVCEVVQRKR